MHRQSHIHKTAFTLLEMIVVIIVIGIMASMVVPRLSGNQDREFNLTVDRVGDVVLMFAHRVSTSNQPSAIRYDPQSRQIELLVKINDEDELYWDIDPLATPITLPSWFESDALAIFVDGELMDTMQWPLTTSPGETRPLIEVSLYWEDRSALISLQSHAMGPNIWLDGYDSELLMPIDLDEEGRGREEW